jgi:hypothetical protein
LLAKMALGFHNSKLLLARCMAAFSPRAGWLTRFPTAVSFMR